MANYDFFPSSHTFKTVSCKRRDDEIPVRGGLAITPSEMEKLTERGIPISSNNIQDQYFDGEKNPSWDIPIDRQRGIDLNDVWETSQKIRNKIKSAHFNDINKYGE